MELQNRIWDRIEDTIIATFPECREISDWMGHNPELSGEEYQACKRHGTFLENKGFSVKAPFCGLPTAYSARLSGCGDGPVVSFLAEYDALPGIGHACGHNVHGAMCLLAAAGLAPVLDELGGEIRVVGTPAEETDGGKVTMSAQGAFDDVDLALMIHCEAGGSYVRYRSLAMNALEFTFRGRSSHAAGAPWEGINALNGAQLMFHAVDMLRQHVRPEVRMHGIIVDGGLAPNIVPETARARFYFRAPWRDYLDALLEKACDCARGAALATGTSVDWELFEQPFDNMKPNGPAEELVEEVFTEMGVTLSEAPGAADSTDVGNVSFRCPALQPVLDIAEGKKIALHTREFADLCLSPKAHDGLLLGARILARTAFLALTEEEHSRRIGRAFLADPETVK